MHDYSEYLEGLYRPGLFNGERDGFICLDKNEAPFSAFELSDGVLSDEDFRTLNTYPNPYRLYEQLSEFVGVEVENLLLTFGSEQAIKFVFNIFLDRDAEVVYPSPSFAMFDVFAYYARAKIRHLYFDGDLKLNIEDILNAITETTSLFVLANPNNPTGTAYGMEELTMIADKCQQVGTIFLLDEAYFHYYDIDSVQLIRKFDNVIITRTFSKAWGLAGLRVGYAISSKKNINLLRKLKPIDEVSALSMKLCSIAIAKADAILSKNISQALKWKNIFRHERLAGLEYIATEGNFILLRSQNYDVHKELLLKNSFLPKLDFSQECLRGCMRFSVSNDEVMEKLIKILK